MDTSVSTLDIFTHTYSETKCWVSPLFTDMQQLPSLLLFLPPHLPLSIIALLRGKKLSAIRDPPPHEMSQDCSGFHGLSFPKLLF